MKKKYLKDYVHDHNHGVRYIGRLYRHSITDEDRKKHSILGAGGGILIILLTLASLSINCLGNRTIYVVLPLEFTLLCSGYYLSGIACFLKAADPMELRVYEGAFLRTVQSLAVALILQVFAIIGEIVVIAGNGDSIGKEEFYWLFLVFLSFCLTLFLLKRQRVLIAAVEEEKEA